MMAGLESHDGGQPRVDKVTILHAGEDLETTVRPLAQILEQRLKLGEQAEYVREFKPDTDIASYIKTSIFVEPIEEHMKFVIIVSEMFSRICSRNPKAFEQIKTKLYSRNCAKSHFALVSPRDTPAQWRNFGCINLSVYVKEIEGGNLAEAIYKQWFGPQATLSPADRSLVDLSVTSPAEDEYAPDKVRIIHAMTNPEDRKYWGKVATAIEDVANPENTTQARLHFRQNCGVAQTLVGDLENFKKCAEMKKVNAVIMWCPNMLHSLNQDTSAKTKFIEILCQDSRPQKLYAHFLFGVDKQQMSHFSQQLWKFLSLHRHMAYIVSSSVNNPTVDYNHFARIFLRSWAGSERAVKSPEESSDPTMNSLEEPFRTTTVSTQHQPDQFHPQQDQGGDRWVMNDNSVNHANANRTREMCRAISSADSTDRDRLLTTDESWNLGLVAAANKSRELQSDSGPYPAGNWGLRGSSMLEGQGAAQGEQPAVVRQPMQGPSGHNKMATGSIGSVSVDSVLGSKVPVGSSGAVPGQQSPAGRGTVSLPAGSERPGLTGANQKMAPARQPAINGSGVNTGHNRCAPSGFPSHSIVSLSSSASTGQGTTHLSLASGLEVNTLTSEGGCISGSTNLASDRNLSLRQNPVRLSSDADHELAQQLNTDVSDVPGIDGSVEPQSCPFMGSRSVPEQDRTSDSTTSQSMPLNSVRPSEQSNSFVSAPEGVNPMQNGESASLVETENVQKPAGMSLLSTLRKPVIRGLEVRLDPIKTTISDWRDLASHFKVPSENINYWRGMMSGHGNCSPTENLIEWLKANQEHTTVEDFKAGLEIIVRKDVTRYLIEQGY